METCGQTIDMEQMVDEFFNNSVIDHVVRWCYQEDPATRALAKEAADCGAQLLPLLGEGMQAQYEDCNFARGLWESAQHQHLWFLGLRAAILGAPDAMPPEAETAHGAAARQDYETRKARLFAQLTEEQAGLFALHEQKSEAVCRRLLPYCWRYGYFWSQTLLARLHG